MTALTGFALAEVAIRVFASPETFTALYDDIIELLQAKYEQSAWDVHSQRDLTQDPEYRDALDRLRQEAEVANRFR